MNCIKKFYYTFLKFYQQKFCNNHVRPLRTNILYIWDFFPCESIFLKFGISFLSQISISSRPKLKWKIHAIISVSLLILFLLLTTINFVYSVVKHRSFIDAVESFAYMGVFVIVLLKNFTIFYLKRETIIEIVAKLDQHFPQSGIDQIRFGVNEKLKWLIFFLKMFVFGYAIVWLIFISLPFAARIYDFLGIRPGEIKLILPIYYPFDKYSSPGYEFAFFMEAWVQLLILIIATVTDLLFSSLVCVLSLELEIIGHLLSEIDEDDDERAITEMKLFIDVHQDLIEVSEKINDIFSPSLFVNILASILVLCNVEFLIMVS